MTRLKLFYESPRTIIVLRELFNERDINTSIFEINPYMDIRKRLSKNALELLMKGENSSKSSYHYYNPHKSVEMKRKEVIKHILKSRPWRKIDRLGKPQILIYE